MFYQTYAACKPPSACIPVTPAAMEWSALLLDDVIYGGVWCTPNVLLMVMMQQIYRFCP